VLCTDVPRVLRKYSRVEKLNCPRCPDEELLRALGNLLVCGSCDRTFVERSTVNISVGTVEIISDRDPGDENDYRPQA
jgi:ribosomal protein S27AE